MEKRINKNVYTWGFTYILGLTGINLMARGRIGLGIIKLVTFGGLGVWQLVDMIIALNKYGKYGGDFVFVDGKWAAEEVQESERRVEKIIYFFVGTVFLGFFGTNWFMRGKIGLGILKCLTFGGFGLWHVIDLLNVVVNYDKYGKDFLFIDGDWGSTYESAPQILRVNKLFYTLVTWFFGFFGADWFLKGSVAMGVLKSITLGGFFIWHFIDLITTLGNYGKYEKNFVFVGGHWGDPDR